ncbi:hypothetical protein MUK42_04788 [Musa troglodytarum]|uniref:Uncharacterized protein n=1 Tax=Musa troglodytarum TaxID=320322 RepID=A0A9E7GAM9_9LILI|nr:hypothetical protein MUK42_04788 [Musa troglodytarum]
MEAGALGFLWVAWHNEYEKFFLASQGGYQPHPGNECDIYSGLGRGVGLGQLRSRYTTRAAYGRGVRLGEPAIEVYDSGSLWSRFMTMVASG